MFCSSGLYNSKSSLLDLKAIKDFIQAKHIISAFKSLTDKICVENVAPLPIDFPDPISFTFEMMPNAFQVSPKNRAQAFKKVADAMFDFKNKQPLLIDYCSSSLIYFNNALNPQQCIAHASLIVGRAPMSDGRCGYWIRNSWGTDKDDDKGVYSQLDGKGNILVPEDTLFSSIREMSVLPPRHEQYKPPESLYKSHSPNNMGVGAIRRIETPYDQDDTDEN